jgi:hypothetical protein
MSVPKEPNHFVPRAQLERQFPGKARTVYLELANYLQLFTNAGAAKVIGESSVSYTKLDHVTGVPERIKEFNEDARFIYIMRDPVQRAISHYFNRVRVGREPRSLMSALKKDTQYVDTSNYAMQLTPWIDLFGLHRIKTIVFEDFASDPCLVIQDVYRWLGVDDRFAPPVVVQKQYVAPQQFRQWRFGNELQVFRETRFWQSYGPLFPRRLRDMADLMASKPVVRDRVPTEKARAYLKDLFTPQVKELSLLLGRDFPQWTNLQ